MTLLLKWAKHKRSYALSFEFMLVFVIARLQKAIWCKQTQSHRLCVISLPFVYHLTCFGSVHNEVPAHLLRKEHITHACCDTAFCPPVCDLINEKHRCLPKCNLGLRMPVCPFMLPPTNGFKVTFFWRCPRYLPHTDVLYRVAVRSINQEVSG